MVFQLRNCFLLSVALIAASSSSYVRASVHTNYNILENFSADGFSASWLYGADSALNGSPGNGALLNGETSSRISGTLSGDLSGDKLLDATGSVSGKLKQLACYLNDVLGTNFSTYTPFELLLGGMSNDGHGHGAFAFETNGAGTGEFTGGFLDFSLVVDGNSLLNGTFFFKPQAESGRDPLSPNRGNGYEFSLWGWNWMHDGASVGGPSEEPDWGGFLSDLGYTGDPVQRTLDDGSAGLLAPLGVAMYLVDPPASTPEPTALVIWGMLAAVATTFSGRHRPIRD